jgi:hypothetical protein
MFSRILLISLCFKNTVTVHSVDKNMEKHIEIMKSKNKIPSVMSFGNFLNVKETENQG